MKFTYYGQSCFSIETGGKKLLFDPFITGNDLAKHIDIDKIEADYILASHGHGDHVADLPSIAKRTGAMVMGMYEVMEWAKKQGVENVRHLNLGSTMFDFGKLHFVPAAHSNTNPDSSCGGVAGGFVVNAPEKKFYFAGDTSLTMEMQLIPRYAKLDFAILPIGGNFTMDVDDAIIAAEFIQCKKIIGVHFDTFGYIKIDHELSKKKFADAGLELILPVIGETVEL